MDYIFNYPVQKELPYEFLSKKQARKIYSRIGFAFFALTVLFHGLAYLFAYIAYRYAPDIYENEVFQFLLSFIPLYLIAVPIFALIIMRLPKIKPEKKKMSAVSFLKVFAICYGLTYAGSLVSTFIVEIIKLLSGNELYDPTASIGETNLWLNFIFIALLAPVLEELVFRKLLCDRLLFLGERQAVIISALSFGLMHGNFQQVIYATLIGVVLGIVYLRKGNIKITIAYHMLINFMGGVVAPYLFEDVISSENTEEALSSFSAFGTLYYIFLMLLVFTGIILFIITAIRFRFKKNALILEKPMSALLTSPGIWLGFAAFLSLFVLQLMSSTAG